MAVHIAEPATPHNYVANHTTANTNALQVDYMRLLVDSCAAMMTSMHDVQSEYHQYPPITNYQSFVQSVFRRGRMTYSVVIIGLLYLARFRHALLQCLHRPTFQLEQDRRRADFIPKMFITALLLSTKFLCDQHDTNGVWAATHMQTLTAVNHSEALFLSVIDYRLGVNERSFSTWMRRIFTPSTVRMYTFAIPPSPPYHLDDLYEQKMVEKRRRLERAV